MGISKGEYTRGVVYQGVDIPEGRTDIPEGRVGIPEGSVLY